MSPVDAEYDAAYALVHDALVGGEETANRLVAEFASEICGSRILDVGAGTGRVARVLSRIASSVVGVELSTDMLARASGLPDNVTLVRGDFSAVLTAESDAAYVKRGSSSLLRRPQRAMIMLTSTWTRPAGPPKEESVNGFPWLKLEDFNLKQHPKPPQKEVPHG